MINKPLRWFLLLILTTIVVYFLWPYFLEVQIPDAGFSSLGSQISRARVLEIIEEGTVDMGDRTQPYQIARVEIVDGDYNGLVAEIDFGKRQLRSDEYRLAAGDLGFQVRLFVRLDGPADHSVA